MVVINKKDKNYGSVIDAASYGLNEEGCLILILLRCPS